jgi:hypothetical protein
VPDHGAQIDARQPDPRLASRDAGHVEQIVDQSRELLHLAVAGCVSNDLFREARALGVRLTRVAITARGEFTGSPPVSGGIGVSVEVWGDAPHAVLRELVDRVDAIAEIPNSLRRGTAVRLSEARVHGSDGQPASPDTGG